MHQINVLEHYCDNLKIHLDCLEETNLTTEQTNILNKLKEEYLGLEKYIKKQYIDFEEICDNLPDAIYIADSNGTTIYVNDCYCELSAISREEVIGGSIFKLNADQELYINGVLPYVLDKKAKTETIGIMVRTNRKVYICGIPIFDSNGALRYAVACDKDIEQLEATKDQLIKLKESHAIKESVNAYLLEQQISKIKLIFKSPVMYDAVSVALAVAPTDATVLITGESGTGKEVISNQIYQSSERVGKPFLKINCSSIPESLMESELFGYEPGSFTGASKKGKIGIFELANGGTLLLDEIGEMSMQMQVKLLRVLQNKEITRVGGNKTIPVDVRIVAATNRDLKKSIEEHTFREDLYYRLNVVPINLPPLRERKEDVEPLMEHFLDEFSKKYNKQIEIYTDAIKLLKSYDWPGNIRELRNVIERLVVINITGIIDRYAISSVLGLQDDILYNSQDDTYNIKSAIEELERHIIKKALSEFGTKRKAALAMGIDHSTLVKKCQKYKI